MISVVIPLYNKECSVKSTLDSVLAQTYTDYEVIVVDDGSTDNSLNVVYSFVHLFTHPPVIKIIHQENSGVSAARNRGIEEAQGEYVAFLDADDLWRPNYLEVLAALIRDYPNAGLYSIGFREIINKKSIPEHISATAQHYRGVVENPWDTNHRIWTGSCCSSRARLFAVGLFDVRMTHGEDLDMWWRLILDGGLVVDTQCCALYRQYTENRVTQNAIPLEKHIPYYMDKYATARATNANFRRYFDEQMIYRLYPYLFDSRYRNEARRIARKIDYSQLKWTMHFRMLFPHIYKFKNKIVRC